MISERERYERAFELFEMPEPAFERLGLRRDRKRRNERVAAGMAAFAILVAVGAIFGRAWVSREPAPADEPTPSPNVAIRFESPFYGYSIELPREWNASPATVIWAEGQPRSSDILNASGELSPSSGFSFNVLIASIALPEGLSAEAWQSREETLFRATRDERTCPDIDPGPVSIEVTGIGGRLVYAAPAGGGCDLLVTFVVDRRGYVISTAGGAAEIHQALIRSVLATIRFEPERAVEAPPSASDWRGIWPQTTREAAEEAQARVDENGVVTAWQVDWNQDGTVAKRFVEEALGWAGAQLNGTSYVPGDAGQTWEAEAVEWYVIRCEAGTANPLYPDDHYGGDCAPTIDETHYEQVLVRTEQLVRQARSGISIVTDWSDVEPFVQAVPPSDPERADALAFVDRFMDARIAGEGADRYLLRGARVYFLHGMPDGTPYSRYEIALGSEWVAEWPFGGYGSVLARLFPESGGGCVIQRIAVMTGEDDRGIPTDELFLSQRTGFSYFKGGYPEGSAKCDAELNIVTLPG